MSISKRAEFLSDSLGQLRKIKLRIAEGSPVRGTVHVWGVGYVWASPSWSFLACSPGFHLSDD